MKLARQLIFELLILTLLLGLALPPRLAGLDQFVTVDEPFWLLSSANFYYALGQRDFSKNVYTYHPAITTMWTITAAFLEYFPEYRGQGQGYQDKYQNFAHWLEVFKKSPLELLKRARVLNVLINVVGLLLIYYLLSLLVGRWLALFIALLIAFDPIYLGNSRLLNHEGLLAIFLAIAILGLIIYLFKSKRKVYLAGSAIFTGLALLTKSPAIFVFPIIFLLMVIRFWQESKSLVCVARCSTQTNQGNTKISPGVTTLVSRYVKDGLLWLLVLALTYVIIWPGMWTAPREMLSQVFGNALGYAFQGTRLPATGQIDLQQLQISSGGFGFYLASFGWSSTPLLWVGVFLSIGSLFKIRTDTETNIYRLLSLAFGCLAVIFIVLFSLTRREGSPHYILTSYVSLEVVSGIGFWQGIKALKNKLVNPKWTWIPALILFGSVVFQIVTALRQSPYYYTYQNPILKALGAARPQYGYGEGLELAAAYLANKPNSEQLEATAFYGIGPFSYYFPGKTRLLLPVTFINAQTISEIYNSDYLVLYYAYEKSLQMPFNLLQAIDEVPPEQSIWLNGVEKVRIYLVNQIPDRVFGALTR